MSLRIAVILANGFEQIEALAPVDIWRRLGLEVTLIAESTMEVVSSHDVRVMAEVGSEAMNVADFDAVFLPGGAGGAVAMRDNPNVLAFIRQMAEAGKWVSAICAAPIVLAKAGVLQGKRATIYPADDLIAVIETAGAEHVGERVVQDGCILTGQGPAVALEFAFFAAKAFDVPDRILDAVKKGILYQ